MRKWHAHLAGCALVMACSSRPAQSAPTPVLTDTELQRLIQALDSMPGDIRSISEGSAQMLQFTFVPEIVNPITAANERAVAGLVACLGKGASSRVRGFERGFVPIGMVCAQVLQGTAFFQDRLTGGQLPGELTDSTNLGEEPTPADLQRAQRAWEKYLQSEMSDGCCLTR
jgi:hypothetical protein